MSSSQIDYIWSSVDVISNFIGCKTVQLASTLTDHSIVILYIENSLNVKNNKKNVPLKKVYNYDKMTEDNCTPLSVFHSNYFYNLMDLHHRLLTAHSKILHFSLNDCNLLEESTRLRIRQLQQKEWLHISPLIV
ncbi:8810_t:CDS:2 [Funneliformis geosporum]|uniref:8810_t:CDS:1 n=1 Tax=Funneliformis geosporum TaxID=1117311 RepID=A0A9W4SVK3_9GLOM|nr:8810_t:CDS:2 [Funneliformis geosporum]